MDRFIAADSAAYYDRSLDLKSNMDRFIALATGANILRLKNLKSNMDRFIGYDCCNQLLSVYIFKIQYG